MEINQITERIIGCAFTVSGTLGAGFLEKVYENALAHELRKAGIRVSQQHPTPVFYDGVVVGDYIADLLVEDRVVVAGVAGRVRYAEQAPPKGPSAAVLGCQHALGRRGHYRAVELIEHGLPEEGRAYMGMTGFKVIINHHGEVVDVAQPGMIADED